MLSMIFDFWIKTTNNAFLSLHRMKMVIFLPFCMILVVVCSLWVIALFLSCKSQADIFLLLLDIPNDFLKG